MIAAAITEKISFRMNPFTIRHRPCQQKRCLLHDMIIPGLTICGFSVILAMASCRCKSFINFVLLHDDAVESSWHQAKMKNSSHPLDDNSPPIHWWEMEY